MKNLTQYLQSFETGESVRYFVNEFDTTGKKIYNGTVISIEEDHIIVNVPEISDHLYFDEDNIDFLKHVQPQNYTQEKAYENNKRNHKDQKWQIIC